jgi:hypothetical protein
MVKVAVWEVLERRRGLSNEGKILQPRKGLVSTTRFLEELCGGTQPPLAATWRKVGREEIGVEVWSASTPDMVEASKTFTLVQ